VKAGVSYGPRNLHESPTEWAAAGLERYRENPVIDTSTQQSTSGGAVEASTNAADTSPDPESSQQTLDKYDNNNN